MIRKEKDEERGIRVIRKEKDEDRGIKNKPDDGAGQREAVADGACGLGRPRARQPGGQATPGRLQ